MTWLRTVIAVLAILHGAGHAIWFIGAWVPAAKLVSTTPWLFSSRVTISSAVGKAFGLLSLLSGIGFVAGGGALLAHASWGPVAILAAAIASIAVVVTWWRASPGTTALNALVVDVALILLGAVPQLREMARLT